ncbi:hypothetical protein PFISCL1PPCAC_20262, partial [Pristionchus fissidentatus]
LTHHSSFFDTLFYGEFKESNQSEIRLEDIDYDVNHTFKILFIPIFTGIPQNNIDIIQKLADRFEMKSILDDAELFLLHSSKMSLAFRLLLADQYNLFTLK